MTTALNLEEYQKDRTFPPDKTDQWSDRPLDEDHWVLSHNSLRGELEEVCKCVTALQEVKSTELEQWQIDSFISVWKYHADHVQLHHKSEEKILEPFVATRAKFPETFSTGHVDLVKQIEKLNQLATREELTKREKVDDFKTLFSKYRESLTAHLKEEEEICLPVIRAFFTPEEFKATGKAMGKEGGHAGSWVYYIGEEKFRNEMMAKLGIPFFVWYLAFAGALKEYKRDVIRHVEALQSGEPPKEEAKWFGIF